MRAMNYSESVLDIKVGTSVFNDFLDKIWVIGFFAGIKTEIFEKSDFDCVGDVFNRFGIFW